MLPVLTTSQMRRIDELAIAGDVTTGFSYMLRAGMGLFETTRGMVPDPGAGDIAIVCGKGNNGGDGYVAGSLLIDAGYRTMCFGLCDGNELSGEARLAYQEYEARHGNSLVISDIDDLGGLPRYALIIDALLGTGIKGDPRGLAAEAIQAINKAGVPVLAVDTPSGLNNDTGGVGDPCVHAATTVTMGFPKVGSFFYPGKSQVGTLVVKDLGYPQDIVEQNHSGVFFPSPWKLRRLVPPRKPAGSKFDHGLVLMVCGSRGMLGSATLATTAALRSGCGMVHAAVPAGAVDVLSTKVTEVVLHPIDETEEGTPGADARLEILDMAARTQCLCIGPGISHNVETTALVRELVAAAELPVVLDADGINAYKNRAEELKGHKNQLLITPHAGEWGRLFDPLPNNPAQAFETLARTAHDYDMTIIYKGNPTRIATPGGKCYLVPAGNSGLASAGSGDVLCGLVAGLVAQGCETSDAALLGVYLHGECANAAAQQRNEYALIASDLLDTIHTAFATLDKP